MAGHSHWAQVKHKKSLLDKRRSQTISKLINTILVLARENPNPELNPKLKNAIERAKDFGVSQDTIERNIKKAQGVLEGNILEEIILEAYGPGGIALLIKCLTDNKNRTISEVKGILNKYNSKLAEAGSVMWLFEEKGVIEIKKENFDEDLLNKLSSYLLDFEEADETIKLFVKVPHLFKTKEIFEKLNIQIISTEIQFVPKSYVNISDKDTNDKILKLVDELLENKDVYEVYANTR